jgi:translation initiation factor IF-2
MAEEKMMRISLAAKKLNVGMVTIVEKLAAKGHRVENNPNAKLNFEHLQILSVEFKNQGLLDGDAPKPVEETKPSSSSSDILYFRETPQVTTPKVEPKAPESAPVAEKPKQPEVARVEITTPKILGKIELDKNNNPVVPKIETPAVATPKVETPVVATPKVEEKPVVVETPVAPKVEEKPVVVETPVVAAPKVEDKPKVVETPKVEPKPQPAVEEKPRFEQRPPQQQQQRPQNQDNRNNRPDNRDNRGNQNDRNRDNRNQRPDNRNDNRPNNQRPDNRNENRPNNRPPMFQPLPREEAKPKIIVFENNNNDTEDVELIKAKGDKLQGLKVLGKIELPVEKKPESAADRKKRKRKRVKRGEKVNNIDEIAKSRDNNNRSGGNNQGGGGNRNQGQGQGQQGGGNNQGGNNQGGGQNRNNNNNNNRGGGNNQGGGQRRERKPEVTQEQVKDQIKQTMARMQSKGPDFGSKFRKDKRKLRAEATEQRLAAEQEEAAILKVTEFISASDLASMMDVSVNEVIAACMGMGMFVSINQRLDAEVIQMIALEFGFDVQFISAEEEIEVVATEEVDAEEDLLFRAPIVTIMGHVDHGKTSLLDYIRRAKVAAGEAGGITQHIGAYSVKINDGPNKGKKIAFLDTPGHEAFTAMRARGAKVTDVVIIVIAADDSVMPQTREAINHAQNAGVPIVFAFNKIDKPGANSPKIREDLSKENILVESWGGKYQEQEVSAKSGLGVDELLDKVLLEAELLDLKANPKRRAVGSVIEAELDKGRGYVSTILVQSGTLRVGDVILAGQYFGKVRAMINDRGERIKEAGPSTPVQILGLPGAPQAGDKFNIMETEREAREIANKREQIIREQSLRARKHITLDEIGRRKAIGTFQQLNVIVKGDVDGSVEALSDSLQKLSTEEVHVNIIHKAVGQVSESDVNLAAAGDAIIVAFQVRPSPNARKIAEQEQIEIRLYSVIYDAINEIRDAMEGMLVPKEEEVIVGTIEVREVFKISKIGTIAGSYVLDGSFKRSNRVRVIREGIVLHDGDILALKRFKDDVNEVKSGYECGISVKGFNDIEIGDTLESYEMKEVKRTL